MIDRRIEECREMFMGEELVYYVTVFEPLPTSSDLNPYGDEGRCCAKLGTHIRPSAPASAPVVAKRVPTKAEFVRAFALVGALPKCVRETVARVGAFVRETRDAFASDRGAMPRRLRKAIARLDLSDLATCYDTGALARVSHYRDEHAARCVAATVLA